YLEEIKSSPIEDEPKRWDLREYLLTKAISKTGEHSEPEASAGLYDHSGKEENRSIETFRSDGSLVLMTGRLSPQKGVDILLDAVPLVRKAIPETRFLLFLLPSNDSDLARTT